MTMDDRTRWNERYRAGDGPTRVNARLQEYLYLLSAGTRSILPAAWGRTLNSWRIGI